MNTVRRTFKNTYIVLFGRLDGGRLTKFSKFSTVEDFKSHLAKKHLKYDCGDGLFINEDDEDSNAGFYICEERYYRETGCIADWHHTELEDFLNNRGSVVSYGEECESVWYACSRYDMTEDENIEAIFNDLKSIDGVEIELELPAGWNFCKTVASAKMYGEYAYGEVFKDWQAESDEQRALKSESNEPEQKRKFIDWDAVDSYLQNLKKRF